MIIRDIINIGKDILVDSPFTRLEAEVILANLLNEKRVYLHININEEVDQFIEKKFIEEINNLKNGKPLQYIIGEMEWQGLDFFCDESTLIPREDTRILLEETKKLVDSYFNGKANIIEIGTGTGILPVVLKRDYPLSSIYTVEKNTKTLEVARKNFKRYDVKVNSFLGDLLEPISVKGDILISNPPYISEVEYENLDKWVKNEPYEALVGKNNGLEFYERIANCSSNIFNDIGYLALEIGWNQFDEVKEIFLEKGFNFLSKAIDDGGRDRVIVLECRK